VMDRISPKASGALSDSRGLARMTVGRVLR
jgi:hypothetical protein